jgi:hypothetical protein
MSDPLKNDIVPNTPKGLFVLNYSGCIVTITGSKVTGKLFCAKIAL